MATASTEGTQEMEVFYTLRDPDGVDYDKAPMNLPIDARIGEFGAMVASEYSKFVPNGGATVYPSGEGNLKACPMTNRLSIYNNKSGTEEAPFHIHLKRKPATAAGEKRFIFGSFLYC